jgi:SH3-like domain-containing protein
MSSRAAFHLLLSGTLALMGLVTVALVSPSAPALAQTAAVGPSGLPLPRFVSLKSGSGVPMEIIQEYDNWRRVRDSDGAEGWVNQSLLSGRRTAIAAPWLVGKETELLLRAMPDTTSRIVAKLEPGVIGTIKMCDGQWCEMEFSGHRGWLSQTQIWGAYPGESYED